MSIAVAISRMETALYPFSLKRWAATDIISSFRESVFIDDAI
jgi:hypothetical protein